VASPAAAAHQTPTDPKAETPCAKIRPPPGSAEPGCFCGDPSPAKGGAATTGGKFGGGATFCGPDVNDLSGALRGGGGGATCRNGVARNPDPGGGTG